MSLQSSSGLSRQPLEPSLWSGVLETGSSCLVGLPGAETEGADVEPSEGQQGVEGPSNQTAGGLKDANQIRDQERAGQR